MQEIQKVFVHQTSSLKSARKCIEINYAKQFGEKTMKLIKLTILSLCLFAFVLSGIAQETPAGKKFAETFWKAISENRDYGAKSALDSLKRREPNFDTTKMEKALADMQAKGAKEKETANTELKSKIEADKILTKLFQRNLQTDSGDTADSTQKEIAENNQLTKKVLTIERSSIQRELDSALRYVKKVLEAGDRNKTKLITRINESMDAKSSEHMYFELLLRQSYLDNARQIFKDETDISTAYEAISNDIKSLGTADDRAAKALKNLNAKIDAERMSRSPVKDAKLEKWFKDMFVDTSAMRNRNYSFLRVVILNNDYNIKRNPITGIVIGRARGADIAFKDKDGKCFHGIYAISQEYVGSSFTNATLSQDFDHREMRCENANK